MASVVEGENEGKVSQTSSINSAATNSMTFPASPQKITQDPPPEHFHGTQGSGLPASPANGVTYSNPLIDARPPPPTQPRVPVSAFAAQALHG